MIGVFSPCLNAQKWCKKHPVPSNIPVVIEGQNSACSTTSLVLKVVSADTNPIPSQYMFEWVSQCNNPADTARGNNYTLNYVEGTCNVLLFAIDKQTQCRSKVIAQHEIHPFTLSPLSLSLFPVCSGDTFSLAAPQETLLTNYEWTIYPTNAASVQNDNFNRTVDILVNRTAFQQEYFYVHLKRQFCGGIEVPVTIKMKTLLEYPPITTDEPPIKKNKTYPEPQITLSPGILQCCDNIPVELSFHIGNNNFIKSAEWDFGDGSFHTFQQTFPADTDITIKHTYSHDRYYATAILTVVDLNGSTHQYKKSINIIENYLEYNYFTFDPSNPPICEGEKLRIIFNPCDEKQLYSWKIGVDGQYSTPSPKNYLIVEHTNDYAVRVTNASGCITQNTTNVVFLNCSQP
jgi:hypothetical protein